VSLDGVRETYERLRGRSFNELRERLRAVSVFGPFGINYVVNSDTLPELDEAAIIAETAGASEFLLLPEQPVNGRRGIDKSTLCALRAWVRNYSNSMRLAISELSSEGMPICDPLPRDIGLRAYAHIDANGVLKRTSYERGGVAIDGHIMAALRELNARSEILL
jgi:MoaA/NifB/PqqE/SkfB family radical SAM enzyme